MQQVKLATKTFSWPWMSNIVLVKAVFVFKDWMVFLSLWKWIENDAGSKNFDIFYSSPFFCHQGQLNPFLKQCIIIQFYYIIQTNNTSNTIESNLYSSCIIPDHVKLTGFHPSLRKIYSFFFQTNPKIFGTL